MAKHGKHHHKKRKGGGGGSVASHSSNASASRQNTSHSAARASAAPQAMPSISPLFEDWLRSHTSELHTKWSWAMFHLKVSVDEKRAILHHLRKPFFHSPTKVYLPTHPQPTHGQEGAYPEQRPAGVKTKPVKGEPSILHAHPKSAGERATQFAAWMRYLTGLSGKFIVAWMSWEEPIPTTVEGGNNFLNIETGVDGGGSGEHSPAAMYMERLSPVGSAHETVNWLRAYQPQVLSQAPNDLAFLTALEASGYAGSKYRYMSLSEFYSGADSHMDMVDVVEKVKPG